MRYLIKVVQNPPVKLQHTIIFPSKYKNPNTYPRQIPLTTLLTQHIHLSALDPLPIPFHFWEKERKKERKKINSFTYSEWLSSLSQGTWRHLISSTPSSLFLIRWIMTQPNRSPKAMEIVTVFNQSNDAADVYLASVKNGAKVRFLPTEIQKYRKKERKKERSTHGRENQMAPDHPTSNKYFRPYPLSAIP